MACYLLNIDPPFKGKSHYTGYTSRDPDVRFKEHEAGRGGVFTSNVVKAGCRLTLVHVWPYGDRKFENKLKKLKHVKFWNPTRNINTFPFPTEKNIDFLLSNLKELSRAAYRRG